MPFRLVHHLCAGLAALVMLVPATSAFAQYDAAPGEERHAARMPQDRFVPAGQGWVRYVKARSGASLTYPGDLFEPLPPTEDGRNRRFVSPDGAAELEFIALPRGGETPASLQQSLIGGEGYENVTYHPRGRSWFVLSGYRGDGIFYEKYMFAGDSVQAFAMAYPASQRHIYDPALEEIEDSFRPAR